MSNLASIQRIDALNSIDGADQIEVADILGWKVVVKKGEFQVGDYCCYCQIDTIAPELPFFEFLRERKFKIKTIKLRKQISQGLAIPLNALECLKEKFVPGIGYYYEIGDDVTELVGITKYSKEVIIPEEKIPIPKIWYKKIWHYAKYRYLVKLFPSLKQVNRAKFPTELVKRTDEERIQNIPGVLNQYKGQRFSVSEKLDGSSITIIYNEKRNWYYKKIKNYRICSRNFELFNKSNEWYKVFDSTYFKIYIDRLVKYFGTTFIIVQGEYIGKPQGNPYKLEDNEIRLFNIFVKGIRLNPVEFHDVTTQFNIPICPLLEIITLDSNLENLLKYAEAKSLLNNSTEREGVVMRSLDGNISFKVISNKFLLKNNE